MHGYIDHGDCQQVFDLFDKMQEDHVCATEYTFVAILKACSRMHILERGQEVHHEIVMEEFENNPFIGNTLIDMYAHCSSPAEAWDVLATLQTQDVLAWNALISGYVECECCEEALKCFEQMQLQGVLPDAVTFKSSLKACSTLGAIERGQQFHTKVIGARLEKDLSISNTLVDMYAHCGSMAKAQEVFDSLPVRDVVSWNALIAGYIEHGFFKDVLVYLDQMQEGKISPNAITYVCGLKACARIKAIEKGQEIHAKLAKQTMEKSLYVCNSLVDLYAQCGLFLEAQKVFNNLLVRDVVTWTALIAGYAAHGLSGDALNSMKEMQINGVSPNAVSWTAIILDFAEEGEIEKASELYQQMQEQGLVPNSVTVVSILKACGEAAALISGRNLHAQVHGSICGLQHYESIIAVALIDMYGKCGSMPDAQQVFDTIPIKGLVEWNALIAGYARHGASEIALSLVEKMKDGDFFLDEVSFVSILSVCSHVGLSMEAQSYFQFMSKMSHISVTIKHHSCLIEVLSRTGQVDEALEVLKKIPSRPDLVMWSSVMAAIRNSRNVNVRRQAFQHIASFNEEHSAALISMLSTNADTDLGDENVVLEIY